MVVSDGTNAYQNPAKHFFANAPRELLEQALRDHGLVSEEWKEYVSPHPSLVIDTGDHKILIDTGVGDILPTTGKLIPRRRATAVHFRRGDPAHLRGAS